MAVDVESDEDEDEEDEGDEDDAEDDGSPASSSTKRPSTGCVARDRFCLWLMDRARTAAGASDDDDDDDDTKSVQSILSEDDEDADDATPVAVSKNQKCVAPVCNVLDELIRASEPRLRSTPPYAAIPKY